MAKKITAKDRETTARKEIEIAMLTIAKKYNVGIEPYMIITAKGAIFKFNITAL